MKKSDNLFSAKSSPSPRKLRVGEEIRHELSSIFMRGECHLVALVTTSITVSEVRVSPDLKNATAFVMPLGGEKKAELMEALKLAAPEIRHMLSKRLKLRYMPRIYYTIDESFEVAAHIDSLLKKPEVARDIDKKD